MYFREEVSVYFLSPFKIYVMANVHGSGFPFSSNFHYR